MQVIWNRIVDNIYSSGVRLEPIQHKVRSMYVIKHPLCQIFNPLMFSAVEHPCDELIYRTRFKCRGRITNL